MILIGSPSGCAAISAARFALSRYAASRFVPNDVATRWSRPNTEVM
jgi:hypothetical protein